MRIAHWIIVFSVSITMIGCRKHSPPPVPLARAATPSLGDDDEAPKLGSGAKKWRDTGVYLDGKPIGVLSFGELPVALQPLWIDEKHSAPIAPGTHDVGYTIVKERRYRFVDYLTAMGIDLRKVKELHVMGPKLSEVFIVSGAELRKPKGRSLLFRFASLVGGKAIPVVPQGLGNQIKPDKIACVMIYVDRTPPVLLPDEGLALDGKPVSGVPYYGEPMRGGVRIYEDDRFTLQIKRPLLRETTPTMVRDGVPRYSLWGLLKSKGVDLDRVSEAWLIADERRTRRLSRQELETITFVMGEKEKNEMKLGDAGWRASAIALHSRALTVAELPAIHPDEEN